MSREEHDTALAVVMTVLGGAVGGFIIMAVGSRLRGSTDAALKRKRFRSYLTLLIRRMEDRPAGDFVYSREAREIPKLDAEILEVRHCIAGRLTVRFDAAIASYKAARFDQWAGPDLKRQQERDATNDKAKAQLVFSLDELYRCAWWMA